MGHGCVAGRLACNAIKLTGSHQDTSSPRKRFPHTSKATTRCDWRMGMSFSVHRINLHNDCMSCDLIGDRCLLAGAAGVGGDGGVVGAGGVQGAPPPITAPHVRVAVGRLAWSSLPPHSTCLIHCAGMVQMPRLPSGISSGALSTPWSTSPLLLWACAISISRGDTQGHEMISGKERISGMVPKCAMYCVPCGCHLPGACSDTFSTACF